MVREREYITVYYRDVFGNYCTKTFSNVSTEDAVEMCVREYKVDRGSIYDVQTDTVEVKANKTLSGASDRVVRAMRGKR